MLLSQPLTVVLVYAGTTLNDLSDVTHDMGEFSKTRLVRATKPPITYINGQLLG
jgi:hypothetical protein